MLRRAFGSDEQRRGGDHRAGRRGRRSRLAAVAAAGLGLAVAAPAAAFHNGGASPGSQLNETGASFESSITVDGNDVTVSVEATGVSPGLAHAQHIHVPDTGSAVCPSPADDADNDGVVTTVEGIPSYGSVRVALTTTGDATASSALALDRFPVADADGAYSYTRTITVDPEIAERVAAGAIVVHGEDFDTSGAYDGDAPSSLDPSVPLEATVPVACGEIVAQQYEAGLVTNELNSSGVTLDGMVQLDGNNVTVTLQVDGVDADLPHAQHVHIPLGTQGVCPTQSDDPDDTDGVLTTLEGAPLYGGVQLSLTTSGDTSPASALAIDRMPVTDDGSYTYVRTIETTDEIVDQITNGVVVVHGIDQDDSGSYDGVPSTLDGSVPQEATLPVACGEITATSFIASATGMSLNDSGAWFDADVYLDGNEVTVSINAYGVAPGLPHAQHLHIPIGPPAMTAVCPTIDDDDNSDGIVDTVEGIPSYGSVQVSLTTTGDTTPASALAVDRFPVGGDDGEYTYTRTFTVSDEVAENIVNAAVVLHGVDFDGSGAYDGDAVSSLDPGLPLEATVPAACGPVSLDNAYTALNPTRLLDTRDGTGADQAPVGAEETIDIKVTGEGGVPSVGVDAVVLNVTATQATEPTFVTAWPTGAEQPFTSNLNPVPGIDLPNLVIVQVGSSGEVSLYNEYGQVELVADVMGYFPAGSQMTAVQPARVLDTRDGTGAPDEAIGPGETLEFDVTGVGGIPADGVDSVVVNLTPATATEASHITAWPGDGDRPTASAVNVRPDFIQSNLAVVKVGDDGNISLYNLQGETDMVADVFGYFPEDTDFTGLTPGRVLDTREGIGAPEGTVGPGEVLTLDVTGVEGVPEDGVGSVVLNITGNRPTMPSHVTVWPGGSERPLASILNLLPGADTPNLAIVKVGPDGTVNLYNFQGDTHLVADVMGYFPR